MNNQVSGYGLCRRCGTAISMVIGVTLLVNGFVVRDVLGNGDQNPQVVDIAVKVKEGPLACALSLVNTLDNPTFATFSLASIAESCVQGGDLEVASKLVKGIALPDKKTALLVAMADGYRDSGDRVKAEDALAAALQTVESIKDENVNYKCELLVMVAAGYARLGEKERSLALINQVSGLMTGKEKAVSKSVFRNIGKIYADVGAYEQAVQEARTMEPPGDLEEKIDLLAYTAGRMGDKEKAGNLLSEALEVFEAHEEQLAPALPKIAAAYARLGMFDRAVSLVDAIDDRYRKSSALLRLVDAYIEIGETRRAADTLRQVFALVKKNSIPTEKFFLLTSIFNACEKIGDKAAAREVLSEGFEVMKALSKTDESRNSFLGQAGAFYAREGNEEKAADMFVQALQEIRDKEEHAASKIIALADIAVYYAQSKREISGKEKEILRQIRAAYGEE